MKLSWRIRAFLAVNVFLWIGWAYTYAVSNSRIGANPSFRVVEEIMPVEWFAVVFLILGLASLGGVIRPIETPTRVVLGLSSVIAVMFGLAVAFAGTTSPAAVSFVGFGLIDLILTGTNYRPRR